MGDLHAIMGDGEVSGTGIEISGEAVVKIEVLKDFKEPMPMLQTEDAISCTASGEALEDACREDNERMGLFIHRRMGAEVYEARMIMSAFYDFMNLPNC